MLELFFSLFLIQAAENAASKKSVTLPSVEIIGKKEKVSPLLGTSRLEISPQQNKNLRAQIAEVPGFLPLPQYQANQNLLFRVRGQDPIQNRTFIEGFSLSESGFGENLEFQFPRESLAAVEVNPYQAPKEDGLGGSIDYFLRTDRKVAVAVEGGSFERVRMWGKMPLIKPLQLHVGYHQSQENYRYFDNHGTIYNQSDDTIETRKHNGFKTLQAIAFWNSPSVKGLLVGEWGKTEVPGPIQLNQPGNLEEKKGFLGMAHDWSTNSFSLRSKIFGRANSSRFESVENNVFKPGLATGVSVGLEEEMQIPLSSAWRVKPFLGFQLESYKVELPAFFSSVAAQERFKIPLGAQLFWETPYLKAQWSAVGNAYWYSGTAEGNFQLYRSELMPAKQWMLFSPRLQIEIPIRNSFRIELGGGFFSRPPSLQELYGSPRGIVPASSLSAEQAWKYSVGGAWSINSLLTASSAFFYSRNFGLISYQISGPGLFQAENIGDSEIWGIESQLSLKVGGFSFLPKFIWMRSVNLSPIQIQLGKLLPFRPQFRFLPEFSFETEKFVVRYWLNWNGKTFLDFSNLVEQPEGIDHNVALTYTSPVGQWSLEALNLFDTLFVSSLVDGIATIQLASGSSGYPSPGRRVSLLWKLEL